MSHHGSGKPCRMKSEDHAELTGPSVALGKLALPVAKHYIKKADRDSHRKAGLCLQEGGKHPSQ